MKVEIRLSETSQSIVIENATNTYTKGPMYCIYIKDEDKVRKFPVNNIFEAQETYRK